MTELACFKAYDIRGRVPDELNPDIAYRVGRAFARQFQPAVVALGRDVRLSSLPLLEATAKGLASCKVRTIDLGLCGTEEVYWAAQQQGIEGGIQITGSHNPMAYNGMKLVRGNAIPVSGDSGLHAIAQAVAADDAPMPDGPSPLQQHSFRDSYVQHLLSYVALSQLRPLKIVVNAGNGGAGAIVDALAPHLPFEFVRIHHEPDGHFPHGIPNPLLPESREATAEAVRASGADFGVAWDGDFDRCFLFDENGDFVEGYYIVGLLAVALLKDHAGEKIIHDPRLIWNTIAEVEAHGGIAVQSKTGHAFIKERMRQENAIYGGEMSAHHYFRRFGYCDNGTIPWLLIAALLSAGEQPLSSMLASCIARFPSSGERNCLVTDTTRTLAAIESLYGPDCVAIDRTDGIGISFADWRFNLRGSNTEPVIRLNVESRGDPELMQSKTDELLAHIQRLG